MKRIDFISPAARLEDAFRQLEAAWQQTREQWNDPISRKVEEEYLLPIQGRVRAMLDAIGRLSGTLKLAEQECLHPRERHRTL